MSNILRRTTFDLINLDDIFFKSLKNQYKEFVDWFKKKSREKTQVYVIDDGTGNNITGFVYLKREDDPIADVSPPLPAEKRIKIGTFKVIAHGTRLGERVIKIIFDEAVSAGVNEVYVTVFDTYAPLIGLFEKYGFHEIGEKKTKNGTEKVLLKKFSDLTGEILHDYPIVHKKNRKKWLLAIFPEHHTKLFPDSILRTEDPSIIKDVPHTNTIRKIYVSRTPLTRMSPKDIIIIYRTTDQIGRARYRSVTTSICVVEETKGKKEFKDLEDFISYIGKNSVFSRKELEDFYNSKNVYTVKMTYNIALPKRPIRDQLIHDVGMHPRARWNLVKLHDSEFEKILELGKVNENIIVD